MQTITEAKKELETKIRNYNFVSGVGIRYDTNQPYIQIGIIDEKYTSRIKEFLLNDKWLGFTVKVIVKPFSNPQ